MKSEGESSLDEAELRYFAELQTLVVRGRVRDPREFRRICCVDANYVDRETTAVASVFEEGRPIDVALYRGRATFPYASGLFYLREGPFVVEAVRRLRVKPHLICFDAHGVAHPRFSGLAATCGAVLGISSIGVAKSRLVGDCVAYRKGLDKIVHGGRVVGLLVNARNRKSYWSPGYSISLPKLESIISRYGQICLDGMREVDRLSRLGSRE